MLSPHDRDGHVVGNTVIGQHRIVYRTLIAPQKLLQIADGCSGRTECWKADAAQVLLAVNAFDKEALVFAALALHQGCNIRCAGNPHGVLALVWLEGFMGRVPMEKRSTRRVGFGGSAVQCGTSNRSACGGSPGGPHP